ncbi:hypothetical protein Bca52824_045721 [Brassica carinata]|uniref:Uncharacterized protein n=1 Tax=Brassica carinata TaxID=52824 RepID=A0A8X7RDQ8_BRACI|nr:hypothetical protein Bca52824_045721 [Brassica carinata]
MEESMRLNWILIDPVKKRAANISSRDAVSAKRNWLTGDLEIRFSTVVAMGKRAAEVAMVVSWIGETWKEVDEEVGGVHEGGEVASRGRRRKVFERKESVVILQGLLEGREVVKMGRKEVEEGMRNTWR